MTPPRDAAHAGRLRTLTDEYLALAGRLFGPGTPTSDLVEYIQAWAAKHLKD